MISNHYVRNSIDVNIKDPKGRTLFHGACDNGHEDVVQLHTWTTANNMTTWRAQPMGHR